MPTSFTEAPHTGEFILSEANGQRSRENGTVASGQDLAAGTVLMLSGGNLVAHDGILDSDGNVVTAVAGIVIDKIDATGGAKAAAYIARDAEVNTNLVTFPTESTAGGEKAACIASLAALGILVR